MSINNSLILTSEQLFELIEFTNIGVWVWYLKTDKVVFSKEYMALLGYEQFELEHNIGTWEMLTLEQDLPGANALIDAHLNGKKDLYEAEFRMRKKDGTIVWMSDKGRITHYDDNGDPLIFCGVMQSVARIKATEDQLREHSSLLNLIINISGFGTWDWDVKKETIRFNSEYLQMLGLPASDMTVSVEKRIASIHPDDFETAFKQLNAYIQGSASKYEAKVRLKHADGHYIWTRDIGRIIERDENGEPTRLIGGHLNIDESMTSQQSLADAYAQLENYQTHLEKQIEIRTKALREHDTMITTVNKVSAKLVAATNYKNFDSVMADCLLELNTVIRRNRVSIWRTEFIDDTLFCRMAFQSNLYYTAYEADILENFNKADIEDITDGKFTKDQQQEFLQYLTEGNDAYTGIDYDKHLPTLAKAIREEKPLNILTTSLTKLEQFYMSFQNVFALLLTPIYLDGKLWGFMMLSDNQEAKIFNEAESNILRLTGSLFANAIQKSETDEELRLAHEEAIMSSQAKSNFLANMSHEIRTPMNAILGMAEIVLRESPNQNITEYASGIKSASNSLLTIINDILDISKIESGKLDITDAEYHLPSMLNDIINIARMRLESKPLTLFTYIDSTLPSILIGDEIRIKQIAINILNNAIKFTQSGHIIFRVTGDYTQKNVNLVFEVIDTGIGIREEDMAKLFDEFERFDTKKNRSIEGTGLGLAISKKLCEMMGGSITAESVIGEGSTFTMRITQSFEKYVPLALVTEPKKVLLYESRDLFIESIKNTVENLGSECDICMNQSELYERLNESHYDYIFTPSLHLKKVQSLVEKQELFTRIVLLAEANYTKYSDEDIYSILLPAHCIQIANVLNNTTSSFAVNAESLSFVAPDAKVLIVDDNQVNLKVATELMRPYGFEMETAKDGLEAVEKIKNNHYDLVFMDHMMPEMDGIDATIAIRSIQEPYFQELPIIALTANAIVGTKELFTREGMNDFLAKPIEISKLNEILSTWLPKEMIIPVAPVQKPRETQNHNFELDNVDVNYGVKLIGGNFDNYIDIVTTYYTDGLKKQPLISDYYHHKNLQAFKTEVHAIKSASASIGALELSSQAAKLEEAAGKTDWLFIDKNIAVFLEDFAILLEELREALKPFLTKSASQGEKTDGDTALLAENLEALSQAIQFVDITQIEEKLEQLQSYTWNETISDALQKISDAITSYDYDEALPYIEEIKKQIS